jgi:hypothetical protein
MASPQGALTQGWSHAKKDRKRTRLFPALRLLPDDLAFLQSRVTNPQAFTLPSAPYVPLPLPINDFRSLTTQ